MICCESILLGKGSPKAATPTDIDIIVGDAPLGVPFFNKLQSNKLQFIFLIDQYFIIRIMK